MSRLFYDRPIWVIGIEEQAETVYRKKSEIPDHLVSQSHFRRKMNDLCGTWFEALLQPSDSAFVSKKTAWRLYDISEYERIKKLYPLRLDRPKLKKGEQLIHKTEARKENIDLSGLEPVFEEQTSWGDWYYLYKVKILQLY